ncbi:polymer-forming cytoskeletal protein [Shewanella sp. ENK2]|uniref:polymer-forming cytoskeletal protein n=1 Tax=Shewanella sp. ENK2 TaxID=2775245 RepID=UPI003747F019
MNNKGNGVTFIGPETSLDGEMTVKGPALIAGQVKGVIRSTDQVKIEVGGEIDGELYCQELRVCGVFKGKLHCNSLVIVSSGVVEGDVSSHKMEIYDGGQFLGARTKGPEQGVLPELAADEQPVAPYSQPFNDEPAYASPKPEAPIAEAPIAQAAKVSNVNVMAEPITNVAVDTPKVKTEIKPDVTPEIKPEFVADEMTVKSEVKSEKPAQAQEIRTPAPLNSVPESEPMPAPKPMSKLEIKPQPNPQAQLAAKAAAEKAQQKKSGATKFVVAGVVLAAAAVGAVVIKPELGEALMAKINSTTNTQSAKSEPAVEDASIANVETTTAVEVIDAETALAELDQAAAAKAVEAEAATELVADVSETSSDSFDESINETLADEQADLLAELEGVDSELTADINTEADDIVESAAASVEDDKTKVDSLLADLLAEERADSTEAAEATEEATTTAGNL